MKCLYLDVIQNLQDDNLEEDDEESFSASPSDVEPDGPIETVRRYFAETLGFGLLETLTKNKIPPKIVSLKNNLVIFFLFICCSNN